MKNKILELADKLEKEQEELKQLKELHKFKSLKIERMESDIRRLISENKKQLPIAIIGDDYMVVVSKENISKEKNIII